jgi:AcrR family transcriptional regulator
MRRPGKEPQASGTAADAADRPNSPRKPQQLRGEKRVERILDAAAELLAQEAVAALKMQTVAERSCTTIGSLYHFFPDVQCLIRALADRHELQILEEIGATSPTPSQWSKLKLSDAVDRFVDPLLRYINEHPDLLELIRYARAHRELSTHEKLDDIRSAMARQLLHARFPKLSSQRQEAVAITMLSMIDGVLRRASQVANQRMRNQLVVEMKRALRGYLAAL